MTGDAAAADESVLRRVAGALADAADAAIPGWVVRVANARLAGAGIDPAGAADDLAGAAERARIEVGGALRELLEADIDEQPVGPLTVLRFAVRYPTAGLRAAGVAPVARDEFARRAFPDDDYDLTPAGFADVDESLREPGLVWGAAKAHVHLARRRAEGRA